MTITKDFKGLQSAARSWFGEHDKGLAALENRTNGALYDALAALFNFHKEWSGKPEYAGLFEGSYIKDAGKGYADLIKLVFFAKSEAASDYRANIAKWAGALMYLKKDTKDIRADLKKTGIAKLYNKYVAGKGSGGGTGSADKVTAAKKVLTARMLTCPTVNSSKISGGDIAKGYHLALVHVDGDKMSIIDTVADEDARDTQKYIKEFAPGKKRTSTAKNAKFKPVYEAIRFADGLKVATHQRAIVIHNTPNEARIMVGLTQEKRDGGVPMASPVALMTVPHIKTLGVGTFVLKQEEANGLKHLWSGARDWDWDFVKTAKKMDGDSVPGYSIVLSNKEQTTADWKKEKTADLKKAAKKSTAKNGKKKSTTYEERKFIGYMPNHMTIQLEKNLGKLEFAQVKSNASYDELGSLPIRLTPTTTTCRVPPLYPGCAHTSPSGCGR